MSDQTFELPSDQTIVNSQNTADHKVRDGRHALHSQETASMKTLIWFVFGVYEREVNRQGLNGVCFHVFADGVPIDKTRWRQRVPLVGNEKENGSLLKKVISELEFVSGI
jgi:hypothetical protein